MDRRSFIKRMSGLALLGSTSLTYLHAEALREMTDNIHLDWTVRLGQTGLSVPVLAMGTGTIGWNGASNQTRLGMDRFVELAHHAYDIGVRFFDMAEEYGSHPFVAKAIKGLPRKELTLQTKIAGTEKLSASDVDKRIDAFCHDLGTDYIDILLMHCMMSGDWPSKNQPAMSALEQAKKDGRVRAVGISCHNIDALRTAAESPWLDVLLARLNPFQSHMDGTPDEIREVLSLARRNGKGVIGMKIFGEGKHVKDEEREQSLRFALTDSPLHCMTIGFESIAQLDDAVSRIMRIKGEKA